MHTLEFPKLGLSFELNSVAFTLFGIEIKWYGVLITLGIILAFLYALKRTRSFGIDPDRMFDVSLAGLVGGVIGARLFYVIFEWDLYKDDLLSIFNTRKGGLAIYGGIIGALLVGALFCKIRKVKLLPMFDLAALGLLIGQCIGRWGNFFNIEAFGSNTDLPWGMYSEQTASYLSAHQNELLLSLGVTVDPRAPVHPCFLYESLWCLIGFILLHFLSKKRRYDGQIFLMYIAWYGVGRFFIEGLRTDSLLIGRLRVSQVLAAVFVIASVITMLIIRSKIKRSGDPDYLPLYVNTEESKALLLEADQRRQEEKERHHRRKKQAEEQENADASAENPPETSASTECVSEDVVDNGQENTDDTEQQGEETKDGTDH